MIAELEVRQVTRASDKLVDESESDATVGRCRRSEFFKFVGERLYVSTKQPDELAQHLIVGRNFQMFQMRLGPCLCFRIFQRHELDDCAGFFFKQKTAYEIDM